MVQIQIISSNRGKSLFYSSYHTATYNNLEKNCYSWNYIKSKLNRTIGYVFPAIYKPLNNIKLIKMIKFLLHSGKNVFLSCFKGIQPVILLFAFTKNNIFFDFFLYLFVGFLKEIKLSKNSYIHYVTVDWFIQEKNADLFCII